jgi:hypothetical protein
LLKSRAPKKRSDRPLDPSRALRSALRAKPRPRPARLLELATAALDRDPALAFETACAIVARRSSERERRRAHELALEAHARANELGAAEEWFRVALDASAIGAGHTLEKAAELARRRAGARGPRRIRVHARVLLARGAYARSAFERSRRLTEDALAIANGGEPDLEVTAHMGLAILASNDLSSDAVRHARRALLVAERAADPLLLARAKAQLGICLAERGLAAEGRAALLDAISIGAADAAGDTECRAQTYLAMLELDSGRPVHALRCLARARELATARGLGYAQAMILGSIGVVHLSRGHTTAAVRDLARAELLLEEFGNRHARIAFLAFLGAAEALAGRPIEANGAFELARSLAGHGEPIRYATELVRALELVHDVSVGSISKRRARAELARIESEGVAARWADVRVACRLLRRVLAGERARVRAEPTPGLLVARDAKWFSFEGAPPVELERRPILRRMLSELVRLRESAPGTTLDRAALIEAMWPEDRRLVASVLENRVNVALATLRRLGLRDAIVTGTGGYRLRDDLPLTIDPG